MNTTELRTLFRTEVSDVETPYLWSDDLVLGYIDDAQKQFCRDAYGIEDARQFSISVTVGESWYSMDPVILKVRQATDSVTGASIPFIPLEKMAMHGMRFDGSSGPVKAFITGLERDMVRAYPVPSVASTVNLAVFRTAEEAHEDCAFEIEAKHERGLLHWVKHLAYSVHDSETYDKRLADAALGAWGAYCLKAKAEWERLNRATGTVAYGGI